MNANDSSLPARGGAPSGMQESVSGSESRAGLLAADRSLARNQARVAGGSSMSAARNDQSRPRLLASPRKGRRVGYDSDLAGYRREQRHDSQRQRRADRCWPAPASAGEEMIGVGRPRHLPLPFGQRGVSEESRLVIRQRFGNLTAHDPRCLWAPSHRCRRGPGCPQVAFRAVVRAQADAVDRRFAAPVRPLLARRA
jgi:hypothetical protein